VLLVDATRLQETGQQGQEWRVHTAYDLVAARLCEVTVTDRHTGESLLHYHLRPNDIAVCDNGYGYRRSVAVAHSQQAQVVLHITPDTFPLEDEQGQPVEVLAWLQAPGPSIRSQVCWCRGPWQRYEVRLVAMALEEEASKKARQRKQQQAREKGKKVSQTTLFLAGWVLLITTLPQSAWSDEEVLRLYRARWQIELVYKRLKQLLHVSALQCETVETAQATIRALLVAWVLQEEEAAGLREELRQVQAEGPLLGTEVVERPISSWQLNALCLDTLRMQVQGQWSSARLRTCASRLQRFVCSSPRQRVHLETRWRRWLTTAPASLGGVGRAPHERGEALSLRL
jgi:hypothetical protein